MKVFSWQSRISEESGVNQERSTARTETPASNQIASAAEWCRCPNPLPKCNNWRCEGCGKKRRYMERISVQNGGIVSRCGECRWTARGKNEAERSVPLTLCRAVTYTTLFAGESRERDTYYLCDTCTDAEIKRNRDADVFDGRQKVPA